MALVKTSQLIEEQGFVLAVNVILLEQAEAYLSAASALDVGLVLQLSENTVDYHGSLAPMGAALLALARESKQQIAVHLDHATRPDLVRSAAELGFSSVMYDGSNLEFEANVAVTKSLREELAGRVWFEAELGEVGGKNGVHSPGVKTDPKAAAEFVLETGVDGLAVAVGSSHAMMEKSTELDFAQIRLLADAVPVPLVLHGSSGVSHENLKIAIKTGIKKINIATELNMVFGASIKKNLDLGPADPRKFLVPARTDLATHLINLYRAVAP